MIVKAYDLQKPLSPELRKHLADVATGGQPDERQHALCQLAWEQLHESPNNVLKFAQFCKFYGLMLDSPILRPGWLRSIREASGSPQIAPPQLGEQLAAAPEPGALTLAREIVLRNIQDLSLEVLAGMVLENATGKYKGNNVNQFSATDNEPITLSINLAGLPRPLDPARRRKLETDAQSDDSKAVRAALVWLNVIDKMQTVDGVRRVAELLANTFKALPADDKLLAADWNFQTGGAVKTYRAVDRDLINGMNRCIATACKMTLDELRSFAVDETALPAEQFSTDGGESVFQVPRNAAERASFERARLRAAAKG